MNKIILITLLLSLISCTSKKDDPLIIPPKYSELPDENNPEAPKEKNKDEDIEKLKELLLKN